MLLSFLGINTKNITITLETLYLTTIRRAEQIKTAVLVTGTPGVGKTTTSKLLASKLNAEYLSVTDLVKSKNLVDAVDEQRDTLVADTVKVSEQIKQILEKAEDYIVIEGHYVVDVVPVQQVKIVFVLRKDPIKLKLVLEQRGYSENKVWENLSSEVLDVCLWDSVSVSGANKVCEIDVSNLTVEEVVNEMLQVLENKEQCRIGTVDWLSKLDAEGKLAEFMQHF
ncbi:MAG: adenylate kinase family protein [Candidatus Bathyarchaeota archaeon]|nr:MAG: adenylate kinase family protein [Candidatus Bathyarchaeota archaeon]